jgi:hypothetical protein
MAQRWEAPFDPAERKDFTRDWSAEMSKSADAIATVAFALPADAEAAGLQIATDYQLNGTLAVVWFVCSDPAALLAAFGGKEVAVSHSITTAAAAPGPRTLHETLMLKIRSK